MFVRTSQTLVVIQTGEKTSRCIFQVGRLDLNSLKRKSELFRIQSIYKQAEKHSASSSGSSLYIQLLTVGSF
jgi:hypothetical protein